ncbi:hypothetical protein R078131_00843 [Convivina intestini]|nr:hypothetical protein R078131_00843 [Convivina intestini]
MTVAVRKMDRIYALYKGDEYVCDGTIAEIAQKQVRHVIRCIG